MGKFFNIDSPFFQWLSKLADIMLLNILFIISSIPILTIGTAATALYDVTMRIARDEGQVWRNYWKAFRSNFKQATLLWLVLLASGLTVGFCFLFYLNADIPGRGIGVVMTAVIFLLWAIISAWVFPFQARFENTIQRILKNALLCGLSYLPRSIAVAFINLLPILVLLVFPAVFFYLAFVWLLLWFSAAALINMYILKKQFNELEKMSNRDI